MSTGEVKDSNNFQCDLYPDARDVLCHLQSTPGLQLAVASRITDIAGAVQLLHLLNIRHYFHWIEIYPTRKTLHFNGLRRKTKIDFKDMIFFDDDWRNIRDVGKLGVLCHQPIGGVNLAFVKTALGIEPK